MDLRLATPNTSDGVRRQKINQAKRRGNVHRSPSTEGAIYQSAQALMHTGADLLHTFSRDSFCTPVGEVKSHTRTRTLLSIRRML